MTGARPAGEARSRVSKLLEISHAALEWASDPRVRVPRKPANHHARASFAGRAGLTGGDGHVKWLLGLVGSCRLQLPG
jgi:hypothetical protein